ncbi:uncharacterized protein [Drosophila takahashii]|uniref:uncharacterized protein n=1 Tax=Drosophila takahashii TaxID=29030 RepID=UPI001CF8EACF|nr:uncharacterized protein LOC108057246 [Drosophila takahashii]XP_016996910.2 uncharacterized protein LOC108057246 [Drosophila takahashii]
MLARAKNICVGHNTLKRWSRLEILAWINEMLQCHIEKIEDLCTGAAYCNLMHMIFPGFINLTRVKFESNQEYEFVANFKELQKCFNHVKVDKHVPVAQLVKGRFNHNLEFAVWFRHFFDANYKKDVCSGYDPLAARNQQPIGVGARNIAVTTPRTARTSRTPRTPRTPMKQARRQGTLVKKQPEKSEEEEKEGMSPRLGKTLPRIHEPGTPLFFLGPNVLAVDGVPPPPEIAGKPDDAKPVPKKVTKPPFSARKKPASTGRNKVEPPLPPVEVPPLDLSDLTEDKAGQPEISTGGRKSVRGSLYKTLLKTTTPTNPTTPPVEKKVLTGRTKLELNKSYIISQDGKVPPLELDGPTGDAVKLVRPAIDTESPYKKDLKGKNMLATTGRNKLEPAKTSLNVEPTEEKEKPVPKISVLRRTLTLVEKWTVPVGGNKVHISTRTPPDKVTLDQVNLKSKDLHSKRITFKEWLAIRSEEMAANQSFNTRDIKAAINQNYFNTDMTDKKCKDKLTIRELKGVKPPEAMDKDAINESDENLVEIYRSPMYNGKSSTTEIKKETVEEEKPQDLGLALDPIPIPEIPAPSQAKIEKELPNEIQLSNDLLNVLAEREVTNEEALAELRLHDDLRLLIKMPDDGKDVDVALATIRQAGDATHEKIIDDA